MDWTQYWFMFPVAICVATCAMLSGIGGAALFIPIFVIIFPLLGPEYPLATSAAIGSALMTEVFGFSSGFIGYYRKRLIDFKSAVPFVSVSIPVAIVGALLFGLLQEQEIILKGAYALLMMSLCPVILRHTPPRDVLAVSAPFLGTLFVTQYRRLSLAVRSDRFSRAGSPSKKLKRRSRSCLGSSGCRWPGLC